MALTWVKKLGKLVLGAPVLALLAAQSGMAADAPNSHDALLDLAPAAVKPAAKVAPKAAATPPASKDELFGLDSKPATTPVTRAAAALPESKAALFDDAALAPSPKDTAASRWHGFLQSELAYTYARPVHWSKIMQRAELGTEGDWGQDVRWKLSGRADYNAVYDLSDYYQSAVRRDQRLNLQVRDAYLDFSGAGLDWRVGRQQIVWGEMVGVFVADVVSAKDLREFILPDFQTLRIPQWAARAEYFKDDFHAEAIWIPLASYDQIGKPKDFSQPGAGSDFYPYPVTPAGFPIVFRDEVTPNASLNHTNYGLRLSQLKNGWDMSGFVYSSMDSQATFYRQLIAVPTTPFFVYTPRHERIWQAGATVAKDLGSFVLKAEAVYTDGRKFNTLDPTTPNGLVKQNTLDWIVGLDFNPTADTRINTQLYQRVYFDHDPTILPERIESAASLLVNHKFAHNWEAEALLVHSLNRNDWMVRPKLSWKFEPNWRVAFGLDTFGGAPTGLFGQYRKQDRVYTELRRDF